MPLALRTDRFVVCQRCSTKVRRHDLRRQEMTGESRLARGAGADEQDEAKLWNV